MKNILSLTKVFIKENLFRNFEKNIVGKLIIYLLVYLYLGGMVVFISYGCIEGLKTFGEEELFISVVMLAYAMLVFIRLIFSCMNVLYYSRDNDILLAYPVKGREIVIAKLNTIIISEYIFELLVFIPALIVYGVYNGLSAQYYVLMTCIGLVFPIIPTILAALVVSVLMRTIKFIRNKDVLQYFAIIIVFCMMLFINIFISNNAEDEVTNVQIAETLIKVRGSISQKLEYMPNIKLFADVLTNSTSIYALAIMTLVSLASLYLAGSFMAVYYARTLLQMNSYQKAKNKKVDFKSSSKFWAYFSKEIKIWIRHPLFLMQCILPPIIFPIIFLIPANSSLKISEDMTSVVFISQEYMAGEGIVRSYS